MPDLNARTPVVQHAASTVALNCNPSRFERLVDLTYFFCRRVRLHSEDELSELARSTARLNQELNPESYAL